MSRTHIFNQKKITVTPTHKKDFQRYHMICTPIFHPQPQKKSFCRTFEGNIAENEVSSILMQLLGKHTHTEHLQFVCVIFDSKYICDILVFLSDPSPIIGNACQWLNDSLTNWLTHWLLFSKLDWCDPGVWRWQLKICYPQSPNKKT